MKRVNVYRTAYCEVCKRPFKRARKHAATCSPACRKARSRAGQKDHAKSETKVTLKQLDFLLRKHGAN